MKHKLHIFLFIVSLVFSHEINAQIYPVQINTQLTPPYSLNLSDFVAPGANRISLTIQNTDATIVEYDIRLRLKIEGNGITVKTSPAFDPGPIYLQGRVPRFFSSSDLYEWFQPQNLVFSGYSKSDYLKTGRLPEGVYRISFDAYDYNKMDYVNTNDYIRVSNSMPVTAWIVLNDPPILNLPFPDYKIERIDPQNIVFQWTPRHKGSPNSAFTTEYEFTMVEIWPLGRNPNDAILTSTPVFQTTTSNNILVYGLAEPFLEPGRQYAYRVRAYDTDGRDMFKNNGYSETRMFTFGDECKPVKTPEVSELKFFSAKISWQPEFTQTSFNLRYRKAGTADAEWFEKETFLTTEKLDNLQASTKYEYQLMAYCGSYEGEYSQLQSFTTPEPEPSKFECGLKDDELNITNKEPLPELLVGDYIWSGMFPFKVTKASGGNGTFSGEGYATIPYLELIKLFVTFENLKINTDRKVYEGSITSVYNPESPFVIGIDLTGGGNDAGDGSNLPIDVQNDTTFTSDIDSVYISDGEIIIVNADGTTDTIPSSEDIIITDSNGDTWMVENGSVLTGGGSSGSGSGAGAGTGANSPTVSSAKDIKLKVEFLSYQNQDYGFDRLAYDVHKPIYELEKIQDADQYIPWKSISSMGIDKVLVKISNYDTSITPGHVKFRTSAGVQLSSFKFEGKADMLLVQLNGKTHHTQEGIEAYISYKETGDTSNTEKELLLAKLNTMSYDKKSINLVIVPVNGAARLSLGEFTTGLNKIYKQSAITWNVSMDSVYTIAREDWDKNEAGEAGYGKMNSTEGTLLDSYSFEQEKFRKKYKRDRGVDKNTYYVFLLNGIESENKWAGYMPLKEQFAFIYTGNTDARTVAHELGHGAFRLWHPFSVKSNYKMAQGSSNNLMDYSQNAEQLHKYQWDFVHDPEGGLYLFQDEDEGAMELQCEDVLKARLAEIKEANSKEENSIKMNWSNDDFDCSLFDVKIGETIFEQIGFVAPFSDYGGEFNFNPSEYLKTELDEFDDIKKDFVKYDFGDFEFEDNQMIMLSVIVLKEQADKLEEYLFSNTRETKISEALTAMEEYLGNDYKQETDNLRTDLTEEGTEYMDCSEFTARFLQKTCGLNNVPNPFNTDKMLESLEDGTFNEFMQHVEGSKELDFKDIQPGDVFLWSRGEGDGHAGVVISYNKETDKVLIIEAIGSSGARSPEESNCVSDGYCNCKGCVRKSLYSRTGNALQSHDGWKGYFRPVIK